MKAHELLTTAKYDLFIPYEFQRDIKEAHVEKLAESMRAYGFLPSKPLQVYREGGKLRLLDGHHRLNAARALGIPVYYVIETARSEETVGTENKLVVKWESFDFVSLYAGKGNSHYQTLLKYQQMGFPLQQAASLLVGESAHSHNVQRHVSSGTFKVKTTAYCDAIVSLWQMSDGTRRVMDICPCIKGRTFIEALSMLLHVEQFDPQLMAKRILANTAMLAKCADRKQALQMLEEIYNFRAKVKLPLVHLAKEAMNSRNRAVTYNTRVGA